MTGTIYNDIKLTTADAQLATSLIIVGAYVGCLLGSTVSERFGRKKGIIWNNIFFIIGALMCGLGNSIEVIFVGRAITGLGFGIETVVVPVLLSEIARPENRGRLTTMHQLQLTLGIMVVGMMSYCCVIYVDHGWRYVQLFYALPCVLMVLLSGFIPESPKYLVALNR
jgi:MFS family permease